MGKTNKLIEAMDFFLETCQQPNRYSSCSECCHDNSANCEYSENAEKIKGIVEQRAQPDEELIQNTYDEIYTHITYDIDMRISIDEDEIKSIIRKLLQERQPEKVRVTRGEIESLWLSEISTKDVISLLKSKGFEITDK